MTLLGLIEWVWKEDSPIKSSRHVIRNLLLLLINEFFNFPDTWLKNEDDYHLTLMIVDKMNAWIPILFVDKSNQPPIYILPNLTLISKYFIFPLKIYTNIFYFSSKIVYFNLSLIVHHHHHHHHNDNNNNRLSLFNFQLLINWWITRLPEENIRVFKNGKKAISLKKCMTVPCIAWSFAMLL